MMDKIVINKITCSGSKSEPLKLMMWRGNKKIMHVLSDDISVARYDEEDMEIPFSRYMDYCKDRLIRIIKMGGIDGIEYDDTDIDEVQESTGPTKYGMFAFKKASSDKVDVIMVGSGVEYKIHMDVETTVHELYKDQNIKTADCITKVDVQCGDTVKTIDVLGGMKSGQLCTPKIMLLDGIEYKFNVTNVRKLSKDKL